MTMKLKSLITDTNYGHYNIFSIKDIEIEINEYTNVWNPFLGMLRYIKRFGYIKLSGDEWTSHPELDYQSRNIDKKYTDNIYFDPNFNYTSSDINYLKIKSEIAIYERDSKINQLI